MAFFPYHVTHAGAGFDHVGVLFPGDPLSPMVLLCHEEVLGTGLLAVARVRGSPDHLFKRRDVSEKSQIKARKNI